MTMAGRGDAQYTVRFPAGLRDRVKAGAKANGRSINAEIVSILEEHYPPPCEDLVNEFLALEQDERLAFLRKIGVIS